MFSLILVPFSLWRLFVLVCANEERVGRVAKLMHGEKRDTAFPLGTSKGKGVEFEFTTVHANQ